MIHGKQYQKSQKIRCNYSLLSTAYYLFQDKKRAMN
jgi:hypothetical protein